MLVARYREALAFKPVVVEEPVDRWFHRRIAAVLVALMPRRVSADHITLVRLPVGWIAAFALYQGFIGVPAWSWSVAAAFLFLAMVLDCADGQLARSRGTASRMGRILDGVVDVLVLLPVYLVIAWGVHALYGALWSVVTVLAALSMWLHTVVFDNVKNLYLARGRFAPDASLWDVGSKEVLVLRESAREEGRHARALLLGLYLAYLRLQGGFAGRAFCGSPT